MIALLLLLCCATPAQRAFCESVCVGASSVQTSVVTGGFRCSCVFRPVPRG